MLVGLWLWQNVGSANHSLNFDSTVRWRHRIGDVFMCAPVKWLCECASSRIEDWLFQVASKTVFWELKRSRRSVQQPAVGRSKKYGCLNLISNSWTKQIRSIFHRYRCRLLFAVVFLLYNCIKWKQCMRAWIFIVVYRQNTNALFFAILHSCIYICN